MNPYLEHPELWAGVHLLLIAALTESLAPQLRPKYRVAVEVRMYQTSGEESLLVGIPDVAVKPSQSATNETTPNVAVAELSTQPLTVNIPMPEIVKQGYLEIKEVATGEVVTAIELLSPVNKRSGDGRKAYETKRLRVLGSSTHLIEIDLLRRWQPMPILNQGIESHYRLLVSRGECRPQADLYAFNLQQKIPLFPLPLKSGDSEPLVDLHQLLNTVYDRGSYDLAIDYSQQPVPPLSEMDAAWADTLLQDQGLR
jgi:hypothetical protein